MRFKLTLLVSVLAFSLYGQKIAKQLEYQDLEYIDGTITTGAELENKVIVVNLWGTWCKPCIQEIPDLNELQKKFESQPDVLFLAIADPSIDTPEKIKRFLSKRNFNFKHLTPQSESIFFHLKGTVTFPTTLVYNKQGKLIKKFNDSLKQNEVDELTELIEDLSEI